MNLLQILPELNVGGVERGVLDLARHLLLGGHKAVVISNGGSMVAELEASGVRHYQLAVHKKSLVNMIRMIPRVVEVIKKEKIDIVHARSRVPAWIAFFAARKTKSIFITTCHGYYARHFFSRVMGWGKLVICPSNIIARHMQDNFGVSQNRLRLIPRSVDLDKFKFVDPETKKGDVFNIGLIARITPLKGHIYFLKAMSKVIRLIPRVKIWIVGDAPSSKQDYKDEIRIMVRRLGLDYCTEFLGSQKNIPAVLNNLNLLVVPSTTPEAFGRVIVEAGACGVPVIASRIGGVVDIIKDNFNGILVAPADPAGIAAAVIKLAKDKKLARQLAENAYKTVREKFSLELMVERTLEVYQEAMNLRNLLIIKLSSLGDLVLSTAAIRAIRERFKDNTKISMLIGSVSKELFINCPYVDELIEFSPKEKNIRGVARLVRDLIQRNFEIVLDLQNNRLSHCLSFMSLAGKRYGYDNAKFGFLLNYRIKDDKTSNIDPLTHQFRILKMLDIVSDSRGLELWFSRQDQAYIDEFLKENWISKDQPLVGINISASKRWKTKTWPLEKIIRLSELLAAKNIRVVLTGTQKDLPRARQLETLVKNTKPIIACGRTSLNQLVCLIKRCQVLVTPDSAPLHIACAVDTPYVALFGPTDASRHLASGYRGIVLEKVLSCRPCYRSKCNHYRCMREISTKEVFEAVEKFL